MKATSPKIEGYQIVTFENKHPDQLSELLGRGTLSNLRAACEFADAIADLVEKRSEHALLFKTFVLFRARNKSIQLLDNQSRLRIDPVPFKEIGPPPAECTQLGRFNLKGDPVLYLATSPEIALAECKALRTDVCTVGRFSVTKDCKLAKFWRQNDVPVGASTVGATEKDYEDWFLTELSNFLSRQFQSNERKQHYTSCNLIASALKQRGFDGITYRTPFWSPNWDDTDDDEINALNNANVVLFDTRSAEVENVYTGTIDWSRPSADIDWSRPIRCD